MPTKQKQDRWPSAAEVDLEARLKNEADDRTEGRGQVSEVNAPYATEETDTEHYIGVSPEYMTHADDRNKPFAAEAGALKELEERLTEPMLVAQQEGVEDRSSRGGGSSNETVYTATSGEGFVSEVATEKPKEGLGRVVPQEDDRARANSGNAADDGDKEGDKEETPAAPPAPPATPQNK